ncbi:hypothetical protein CENSYa_1643 [Cenarchaeum symbiosum A]|uniref:Uncharacterized protein n=1 Tax=Cenarchaeum symbiosum (strain A) TaxID=414004 RepID=A0RY44_CENSY|nr:hypothetical protein CENSYa_1643 [Cenarchaeum symbiosum A]
MFCTEGKRQKGRDKIGYTEHIQTSRRRGDTSEGGVAPSCGACAAGASRVAAKSGCLRRGAWSYRVCRGARPWAMP